MKKQDRWQTGIGMNRIPGTCTYRIICNDDGITICTHYGVSKRIAKNAYRRHTGKRLATAFKRGYWE